ncbi:MAG: hypothetical protein AAB600_04855 [Patescibacteria group bacterium]
MSEIIKKENLVILSGWTRDRNSYKKLIEAALIDFFVSSMLISKLSSNLYG